MLDIVEQRPWEQYLGSTMAVSHDCGKTFSEPMVLPITSPHGPCQLQDGRILYIGRTFSGIDAPTHIECHIVTSDGKTECISTIADLAPHLVLCEPHAIQLKNGRILVHIRVQHNHLSDREYFTIYQSISDDMGKTFSQPVPILGDQGGAPAHLIQHSSGTVISVYGYRKSPFGIRTMFSKNNGETWDTDHILVDDEPTADLGYPASVERSDGSILTVYYAFDPGQTVACTSNIKQIIWKIEE